MINSTEKFNSGVKCADSHDFMQGEGDKTGAGSQEDFPGSIPVRSRADSPVSARSETGRSTSRATDGPMADRLGPASPASSLGTRAGESSRAMPEWAGAMADQATGMGASPGAAHSTPEEAASEASEEVASEDAARVTSGICSSDWEQIRTVDQAGSPMADHSAGSGVPEPLRRQKRSQSGIVREKTYTDGTIRYDKVKRAFLTSTGEPIHLHDALASQEWKKAMDTEYEALMKNKTWRLVPPKRVKMWLIVNGFTRLRESLMAVLTDTNLD